MTHVDALSRTPVNSIHKYSTAELQELQEFDEHICGISDWVQEDRRPDRKPNDASNVLYHNFN